MIGDCDAGDFEEIGHAGLWQILVSVAALGGSFGAAVYCYARLRRLYGNYVESLRRFALVERAAETE